MTPLKPEEPIDVRVMTFNFRYANPKDGDNNWENRKEFVAEVIRDYAPDVLGVQEPYRSQLDDVRQRLPEYVEVGIGRDDGTKGEYSAILYRAERFEMASSGTFWLSETPSKPSQDWGSACSRICTWAQLTDRNSGKSFFIYNTHLDHKSKEAQLKGARLIMEHAKKRSLKAPLILTGDLNVGEHDPVIKFLKGAGAEEESRDVLIDSFRVLHPDEQAVGTYHAFKGNTGGEKIDYVLTSPDVQTLEATIIRTSRDGRYPSDHFPVTARIRFEEDRKQKSGVRH